MNVLLVDDSEQTRSVERKILEQLGDVKFAEAGDGLQALLVIAGRTEPFDLILIDCHMPNMNGITLARTIRENDKKTPLVMVSTEADRKHVVLAIRAGVNCLVLKPFTAEVLLEKVRATLGRLAAAA